MTIGQRGIGRVLLAPFRSAHYRAAFRGMGVYEHPLAETLRYLASSGHYPRSINLRTPSGLIAAKLYTHHDMKTVNEIFCRMDYPADASDKIVVDFGSNIGISALYFLSRGPGVFCYLFEPLPFNLERLRGNLERFAGQYELAEVAVALEDGELEFGYEPTGRYGGIGLVHEQSMRVRSVRAGAVIDRILEKHGHIDIVKIDIESLEKEILASLTVGQLRHIRRIYIEQQYRSNPLPADMFSFRQQLNVAQFVQTCAPS